MNISQQAVCQYIDKINKKWLNKNIDEMYENNRT